MNAMKLGLACKRPNLTGGGKGVFLKWPGVGRFLQSDYQPMNISIIRKRFFLMLLATIAVRAMGQTAQTTEYAVVERGLDYNVMQRSVIQNGITNTQSYVALATGMNYLNDSGELTPASEQITVLPSGAAAAIQGRHKVNFPANINGGTIQIVTPDGLTLQSRPLGIVYDDGSNAVFIATLTNSVGTLTASNQITYPNCFSGIKADLVCTYHRGGFECDLVFRAQPPLPASLRLNPASTILRLVTEFFNTPDPEQIPAANDPVYGLEDATLQFGQLALGRGRAFAVGATNALPPIRSGSPMVYKNWSHIGGRTFLTETIPLARLAAALASLPEYAGGPEVPGDRLYATSRLVYPPARENVRDTNQMIASIALAPEPGVVLDYVSLINYTTNGDYTFQSNVTYYISGDVAIGGTLTIQGGSVVKFERNSDLSPGGVTCQTGPGNLAYFTAVDDDSVGVPIAGSTGHPTNFYANAAINQPCGETYIGGEWVGGIEPSLSYLRFSYAEVAVVNVEADIGLDLRNSILSKCYIGIISGGVHGTYTPIFSARNVLFDRIYNSAFFGEPFDARAENITISGTNAAGSSLVYAVYPDELSGYSLELVNCLGMTNVYWGIAYAGGRSPLSGDECRSNLDLSAFDTVDYGNYYLAPGSPYRGIGATNSLDPAWVNGPPLYPDLRAKTTYAPNYGGSLDTNTPGHFDLGYHYDPYIFTPLGANRSYITNSNLIVCYKLNDGSGSTATDCISGYNSAFAFAPSWGTNYVTLNGTNYGAAGDDVNLNGQDCAIMAWVNESQIDSNFHGILDKSDLTTHHGWGFWLNTDNSLMFAENNHSIIDNGPAKIYAGQWAHVAIVWDHSAQKGTFYINGLYNSDRFNAGVQDLNSPGVALQLGNIDGGFYVFKGSLKQVALYSNLTLSASEIETNFLQTESYTNIYYPSLLYYKFTETNQPTGPAYFADGSLHGGTTGTYLTDSDNDVWWTNNQVGTPGVALHFHGEYTCVDTSNSIDFNFTTNLFTVNLWTRPDTGGKTIFDNNRCGTNGWSIQVGPGGGNVILSNAYYQVFSQASAVPQNVWSMVTVIRDASSHASIYVNGQFNSAGPFCDITPSSSSLRIGGGVTTSGDVTNNAYDGDIWGVQIWGHPLTPVDVANLWFNQKNGKNWP